MASDIINIIDNSAVVTIVNGGPQGTPGVGLPAGGTAGQIAQKATDDDYDFEWVPNSASVTSLNVVGDVTITSAVSGDLLAWDGVGWVNQAVADAGITIADIADLQEELDARPELIGGELGPGADLDALSNVTITTVASGEVVVFTGSVWENQTLAEAGISGVGHTHTLSDISDAGTAAAAATGDFAAASHTHTLSEVTDAGTAAGLDVAAVGDAAVGEIVKGNDTRLTDARTPSAHTHTASDTTSGTFADARISESSVTQHEAALSVTSSQISDLPAISMSEIRCTSDGGGSAPDAVTLETYIEQDCNLHTASIYADVSGSIVATVKRDRSATVTTLGTVTLSASQGVRVTDLSGWSSVSLEAGDILIVEWGAGTTLTRATLTLGRTAA